MVLQDPTPFFFVYELVNRQLLCKGLLFSVAKTFICFGWVQDAEIDCSALMKLRLNGRHEDPPQGMVITERATRFRKTQRVIRVIARQIVLVRPSPIAPRLRSLGMLL